MKFSPAALKLLIGLLVLFSYSSYAQNPSLSVGLETLTMNKGEINVEVLTEIIIEKQKELKQEALKRFMLKLFPDAGYASKFYVQHSLNILLNEKNPQVIKKELLELTTNYALVLGIAKVVSEKNIAAKANSFYKTNKLKIIGLGFRDSKFNITNAEVEKKLKALAYAEKKLEDHLKSNSQINDTALRFENDRIAAQERLRKEMLKQGVKGLPVENLDNVPFTLLADVVAAALSSMPQLKSRGFFKTSINYKNDDFYRTLGRADTETVNAKFKVALDQLQLDIVDYITPYITSYEVIKEFFSEKIELSNTSSINEALSNRYMARIMEMVGGSSGITEIIPAVELRGLSSNLVAIYGRLDNFLTLQKQTVSYKRSLLLLKDLTKEYSRYNNAKQHLADSSKNVFDSQLLSIKSLIEKTADDLRSNRLAMGNRLSELKFNLSAFTLPSDLTKIDTATIDNAAIQTDALYDSLSKNVRETGEGMIKDGSLLKIFLSNLLAKISDGRDLTVTLSAGQTAAQVNEYAQALSDIYLRLSKYAGQEEISLKDIKYIDEEVVPAFVKYGVVFSQNNANFKDAVKKFRLLAEMLKMKAIINVAKLQNYDNQLSDLLGFIANLDNLDHAEAYQFMLNILEDANGKLEQSLENSKYRDVYHVFSNSIQKYTLVNIQEQYVTVDVVSFLSSLQQYFDRNDESRFGLYMSLGLSQNYFLKDVTLPGQTDRLYNIGFASEKIGVRFRIKRFNRFKGYENSVKDDVLLNKRAPFINDVYYLAYGSGLLYSIANTSTNKSFSYAHFGTGFGLRFYNALDVNATIGLPFIKGKNPFKSAFVGIGFDIPLGEYLEKLGNKK